MKILLRLYLLLLAFTPLAARAQVADAGASFSCDGKLYQIRQVGTTTHLFRVDRTATPYTTVDLKDLGVNLNALAYNQLDGYLYAITYSDATAPLLYKIGVNGAQSLGNIRTGLIGTNNIPSQKYAGGAIDQNGIYYFSVETGSNSLYRIDLTSITALTPRVSATIVDLPGTTTYYFYDLAINPLDNELYGTYNEGNLFRIIPNAAGSAATVANISSVTAVNNGSHPVGTAFFDAAGTLLVASNGTFNGTDAGNFYIVDISTSQTASTWVKVTTLPRSSQSDGASCIYPPQDIDVIKTLTNVTRVSASVNDITYTIKVKNTATEVGVNATNIQVSEFLFLTATGDNASNITFGTANIPGTTNGSSIQSLAITDDDPSVTFALNNGTSTTSFNGTSASNGARAGLLALGQTLNQGRTLTITLTVRVNYTGGTVPSTAQLNTAIASSSASSNAGYRLDATSGVLIPPIDLLAADQSTNTTTLPSSPNADTPSPTPVNFSASIAGTVFEDVNYGGGNGRSRVASSGIGARNALVELYDLSGTYRASTNTDANGFYSFGGLTNGTEYVVRVVNSSIKSSREGGATATTTVPVQTYANASKVGGNFPAGIDAASNTTSARLPATAQSTLTIAAAVGNPATADFGFNFDLIVNTNASGQGSLNQFILNSNALLNDNTDASTGNDLNQVGQTPGVETSIFMIPSSALTNGVAIINQGSALTAISDKNTAINGTTQTANIGDLNTAVLGTGGTVGTAATTLSKVNGPEVQIVGSSTIAIGLDVASTATNTSISGISIYGFGNGTDTDNNANIRLAADNAKLSQNVIGSTATSFAAPTVATNADHIRITGGTGTEITNNLIGFSNSKGIAINNGVSGTTITNNEIRSNARTATNLDGISIQGLSAVVTGNLIINNNGNGIDSFNGGGSNTISGNTITGNGVGNVETAAIRLYGSGSTVSSNVINANYGAGILGAAGSNNNTFSRNSIYSNGTIAGNNAAATNQIGIDLLSSTDDANKGASPFVTLNDNNGTTNDTDTGANSLLNFPVVQSATIRNGNLLLTGYATANSALEFFIAAADGSGFGEGQTYLFTRTEGSTADLNQGTGSYSGVINGVNQGAEINQNLFSFSIPLSGLTATQQSALTTAGVVLTATATVTGTGTSEFSGNAPVLPALVANNDLATTTVGTAVTFSAVGNDSPAALLDATTVDLDPNTAGIQASYTVADQGTFTTVGVPAGQVKFTPVNNTFAGISTIPYVVSNTSGALSNQANLSVAVNPALDLVTTITAPTNNSSVTAGASLTYTVNYRNGNSFDVGNVTQTLQLPAGLANNGGTVTFTGAPAGAAYDNTTGIVTFTPTAVTMAAGTTSTYGVLISKAPANGTITATSTISSTGNGYESDMRNNVAVNTATITPSYDVTTTLAGPVNQAGNAVAVVGGDLVTYTVKTTNNTTSVSTAPNVVQTVSFDGDLTGTGVYVSNGGTYAYNSTTKKTVVTFPALTTLAAGQSIVNTISFVAPATATSYLATATVTANTNGGNAGDTNTTNNSTSLTTNVKAATGNSANIYTKIETNTTVATPGQIVRLTVITGNNGPNAADNVVQQVMLPAGLSTVTFPNSNGSYNPTTGIVTFDKLATLNSASTNPTAFLIDFATPATGPVLATASVSMDNPDPIDSDNVAEVKVDVKANTDVATLIEGPTTATVGQTVTYTVMTTNNSATTAYGVVQTVQLPAGLGAGSVTFSGSTTGSYDNATGVAAFAFTDPLTAGVRQTNTVSFSVPTSTIADPAASNNRLSVAASVRASTAESTMVNNSASVVTTIMPTTDVSVRVSGPSTALIGSPVTYTLTTSNNGPSVVASVVPSLQLPSGLTSNGGTVMITGAGTAAANYNNTTGLVTFPSLTNLAASTSVSNTITVTMPDVTQLTPVAQVQVGSATYDSNLDNNRDQVTTSAAPATATNADLATFISVTTGGTSPAPGTAMVLTANFRNETVGSTVNTAVLRVALPASLNTSSNNVVASNNGTYDNVTGLVTWPASTLTNGSPLAYTISFRAPASGSVTATSFVSSSISDATLTNNVSSVPLTVTSQTDVTTAVTGPTTSAPGTRVTYAVATVNNGSSPASNGITQTVTVPLGVTNLTYPAGSSLNGNVITFPTITAAAVGTVMNYVSFDAPATTYIVKGDVSMTGDLVTTNNSSSKNTTVNQVPVAYAVVNTAQSPQGSTAGALLISPLVATDMDVSSTLTYRVTALPSASTGALTLGGTTPVTLSTVLQAADLMNLYFNPVGTGTPADPTYVGNAFFTYTATDNFGAVSAPALYTIQIGQDLASTYTAEKVKGGSAGAYQNGDVITNAFDINAAKYNNSLTLTDNGVRSATTDATGATTLSTYGLKLNPTTGQVTVENRLLLRAGSYTVNITTVDTYGGTNTRPLTLTIGTAPLPVELTAFTATAKATDAVLAWTTASEKNNDHFVVERSLDGSQFAAVGTVAGHGTTTEIHTYRFVDQAAARLGQQVYYRLRQVDTDSTESFSPVRTVQFAATTAVALELYPNPAVDQATLDLTHIPAGTYSVTLLDQTGRVLNTQQVVGGALHKLDVQSLPTGAYLVTINGGSIHLSKRLLKQ